VLERLCAAAQRLEDVLHLVRQRSHLREAHRAAHPLQRVRDAEDLVDRVAILRRLLDPDDGDVQVLQVLPALCQEHAEVLGEVHQAAFR